MMFRFRKYNGIERPCKFASAMPAGDNACNADNNVLPLASLQKGAANEKPDKQPDKISPEQRQGLTESRR